MKKTIALLMALVLVLGLAALANVSSLGLFKPENDLEKYVSAFSAKLKAPEKVYTGIDTFLRMIEYIICKNN